MSLVRAPSRAYLPGPGLTLILRAALLDGPTARLAWLDGRSAFALPERDQNPAARWLGPLLAVNVERIGLGDDPLLPALRAMREVVAQRNDKLFDHVSELVRAYSSEGVDVMLLKGAALVGGEGRDPSVRPMSDIDLLVRPAYVMHAIGIAEGTGWTARQAVGPSFLAVKHAAHFADVDGCQLDLHWYVFEECCIPAIDDGIWARSLPTELRGTAARCPSPSDAVLHACVHGARWTRTPGVRWASDAWAIINGSDVSWETLLEEAERRAFVVRLRSTLTYLRRALDTPVPDWVQGQLATARTGIMERLEHAALGYEQRRLGALPSYWFNFHRARGADGPVALLAFPAYLGAAWNVDSPAALVLAAAGRVNARLRSSRPIP